VGGCTNCAEKSGCDDRKGTMLEAVDDVLARVYPSRTWGEVDDDARGDGGVTEEEGVALAEELAAELDAATFWVRGDECDAIWILCLGRTPCVAQVRDFGVSPPDEWAVAQGPIRELYLRVVLSPLARLAAVQEVVLEAERADGGWVVKEKPRAGVYDAPLLRRLQRLVAILPAYDLVSVDFGDISAPPPEFSPGEWPALYGAPAPSVANYLFFAQPATMVTTRVVAA
jgi:hypothetical protein